MLASTRRVSKGVCIAAAVLLAPICAVAGQQNRQMSVQRDPSVWIDLGFVAEGGRVPYAECCTDPGQFAECWWDDAIRDKVTCTKATGGAASCETATCDTKHSDPRNPATGLCTCTKDDDCNKNCAGYLSAAPGSRCGVCVKSGAGPGVCGPSFCNGHKVCSCWGGCADVHPPKADPSAVPPTYDNFYQLCADTAAGMAGFCCEGNYPGQTTGVESGYCSSDAAKCSGGASGCKGDVDCASAFGLNPCVNPVCNRLTGQCQPRASLATMCKNGDPVRTGFESPTVCCCDVSAACPSTPCIGTATCIVNPGSPRMYQCLFDPDREGSSCAGEGNASVDPDTSDSPCKRWQCQNTLTSATADLRMECLPHQKLEGESCADSATDTDTVTDRIDGECEKWRCEDADTDTTTARICDKDNTSFEKLPCNVPAAPSADACSKMFCKIVGGKGACSPGKDPGDACMPVAGLTGMSACYAYRCSAAATALDPRTKTCTQDPTPYFPPTTPANIAMDAAAENCSRFGLAGANSLGDVAANPAISGDMTCADDNLEIYDDVESANPRFAACNLTDYSDYAFWYREVIDRNAFGLKHAAITLKQSASAPRTWNPVLATQRGDCGNTPDAQFTCGDDCNFLGTNYSGAIDCATLDLRDAAVTAGPWPVRDNPAFSAPMAAIPPNDWDGNAFDDGFYAHAAWNIAVLADSRQSTNPLPPGGAFDLSLRYEGHSNNSCINTASYVAAPVIRGDQIWKERWRGTFEGYNNFICRTAGPNPKVEDVAGGTADCIDDATNQPLAAACYAGGGASVTQNEPGQAFYRVDLPRGKFKVYTDEAGATWSSAGWLAKDAPVGTPYANADFQSVVMAFYGGGTAADGSCLGALDPSSATCIGGNLGQPRERLFNESTTPWRGWLEISNRTARSAGVGTPADYELNVIKVPQQFLGMTSVFYGVSSGGGCGCSDPVGTWPLEGYRIDYVPTNTVASGYAVLSKHITASPDYWLFDPAANVAEGLLASRKVECTGDGCVTRAAGGPYPLPFVMPFSGDFYGYYCIDAAGRIDLRKSSSVAAAKCPAFDNDANSQKMTVSYEAGATLGYAPAIYPAWGKIVPCWRSIREDFLFGSFPLPGWMQCKPGYGGQIIRQTGVFEGTTAEIITFDGFDGFLYPSETRADRRDSLQFQVILRIDGRVTFFYKQPPTASAWDRILDWNGWSVGLSGSKSVRCAGQASPDTYCRTQLGSPANTDIVCDDDPIDVEGNKIYTPQDYCVNRIDNRIVNGISGP